MSSSETARRAALTVSALVGLAACRLALGAVKPLPKGATSITLPNGMRIAQWQKKETKVLYQEIFGSGSAYLHGNHIIFRPGQIIVDAGANIGMFSLFAALQCAGDAEIFAFEPVPTSYAVLSANCTAANNGEYTAVMGATPDATLKIHPINRGLSNQTEDVVLQHHPMWSLWSTRDADFARQRLDRIVGDVVRTVRVLPPRLVRLLARPRIRSVGRIEEVTATLIPLRSVIENQQIGRIDILKVDVEGAEIAVLEGIAPNQWNMIRQVVLEVEHFAAKDRVIDMLEQRGFATDWFASERERNRRVLSEVCMVYAWRAEDRDTVGATR